MASRLSSAGRAFTVVALCFPAEGAAQEATFSGTVTDSTGGVLPGVAVQGNTFMAVTDGRGEYQLAVRVGTYPLTVQLQGFTSVTGAESKP